MSLVFFYYLVFWLGKTFFLNNFQIFHWRFIPMRYSNFKMILHDQMYVPLSVCFVFNLDLNLLFLANSYEIMFYCDAAECCESAQWRTALSTCYQHFICRPALIMLSSFFSECVLVSVFSFILDFPLDLICNLTKFSWYCV